MGTLGLPTESTIHWEDNIGCISMVESKQVNPRVKHINIMVFFFNNNTTMDYLFSNMRKLSLCRWICALNPVLVP